MTAEELLRPRFEVIALWPGSGSIKIGDILEGRKTLDEISDNWIKEKLKYPYLFRHLNWWEKRKIKDMPKKVCFHNGTVYKIKEWDLCHYTAKTYTGYITLPIWNSSKGFGYFPID